MGSLFVRDRQFYRHFFVIALPVVLQSCITIGVNMLDTIMLGSFGEGYLSATSLSNQFFNLYQIICMGLGGGAAVLTAQAWGRKHVTDRINAIAVAIHAGMTPEQLGQVDFVYSSSVSSIWDPIQVVCNEAL